MSTHCDVTPPALVPLWVWEWCWLVVYPCPVWMEILQGDDKIRINVTSQRRPISFREQRGDDALSDERILGVTLETGQPRTWT